MYRVISRIAVFALVISLASSANILDFFTWNSSEDGEVEQRDDTPSACNCEGPSCRCCVDFNYTYIDFGGSGCILMKYISQQEGITVNVSFGESLLHTEQIQGPNPPPTCMSLLPNLDKNLAQLCAQFSDLVPHNDGLRGCLQFQPKLVGSVTTSFDIGCFTMGPEGMKLEENSNSTLAPFLDIGSESSANETTSESEGLNEEELIAAVNESAEQGLVFFGNLLGLAFGKPETNETNIEVVTPATNSNETTPKP